MPLKRSRQSRNFQGVLLVLVLVLAGGLLLLRGAPPALTFTVPSQPLPTPTPEGPGWEQVLQQRVVENATPLATVELPAAQFVPPTLPPAEADAGAALEPTQLFGTEFPTNTPLPPPPSPTPFGPTPQPSPTDQIEVVSVAAADDDHRWQPPSLQGPISLDPRDHYWLSRPVDSNATNYGLFYYSYGSDGPDNLWRVHHGIDMSNPIGQSVRAAGSGTVLWAAASFRVELPDGSISEPTSSYGNTVLIQHDFSYRGQTIYTLYAHLSAILVSRGQRVETGDIIGLVGATGQVSGPHVHLEVRLGQNSWYAVRNPILWLTPYIGHGTIAGRVYSPDGQLLADQDISVIDRVTGRIVQTTTSYIPADTNNDRVSDINPDDVWQENFALGDIPEGRYQVVTRIDGQRVARIVDVFEGTTSFVELELAPETTPQSPPATSG
ncbi:MAG: M23 family metallopeptidase [Anaerolineae bacterium]|nr:M23 family metallopeptidase [Anaerolineae bacterium]